MYYETPLLRSVYFPQPVFLKLENTQPSGSFKSRGLTNLIAAKSKGVGNFHVYSSSGGNAGLAAAEAAFGLGIPCTVVVPETTKPRMISRIHKLNAQVEIVGKVYQEADQYLRGHISQLKNETPIYCHAFDNELIWQGHSTMVDEILEQIKGYNVDIGAIVLSCGGGGLYLGVMTGLIRHNLADKIKVIVVETEGAPTFHEALKAGESVTLKSINTIATSLGSSYVPQKAVEYAKKFNTTSLLISDNEALKAVNQFAEDHCIVVEPACAATLSAIYSSKIDVKGPIVAIVCGGSGWTLT